MGEKHFESDEDLQKTVTAYLSELVAKEYDAGIEKLIERYFKCRR